MERRLSFVSVSILALLFTGLQGCAAESADASSAAEDTAEIGVVAQALGSASFDVAFNGCSELASITTISVAKARQVVPSSFTLAGDASGTPFVVRVADCTSVSVDGATPEAGTVAQLGVSVVSPDGTGDINNYTAWYYTTSLRLAAKLRLFGVPAQFVPTLDYDYAPNAASTGGTLRIAVPGTPAFRVSAPVVEPGASAIPFTANWWQQTDVRRVKMSTPIPAIRFGAATATLQTARAGDLGKLLESSTETFALLDSFNRFDTAPMTVTVTAR
jgi:hypothetical protein